MQPRVILSSLVLLALLAPALFAQGAGGTILGTITDSSGAVVVNAEVVIRNVATGAVRTMKTNEQGFFSAPDLNPGGYEMHVTAQGFDTEVLPGLILTVGAELTVNPRLRVGNISEKVEVTGAAAAVELTTSMLSHVVDEHTITELPLNGRDWTQLATLQPGVAVVKSQNTGDTLRVQRGQGVQMTISGGRPAENNYRVNGISINDYANTAPGSSLGVNLGVDAIQEFSVLTSTFSSEYGRTAGGVVNAVTRSGANAVHGAGYYFHRNSALDARNFFDRTSSPPPFRRHQFGGSAGGPIKRDKTFWFVDYEGFRESLGITTTSKVPSPAARNGTLVSKGVTSQVQIDGAVKPYLAIYPLPNAGLTSDPNVGLFAIAGQRVSHENFVTTRMDHRFSERDSLNGVFLYDNGLVNNPDEFNNKPQLEPSRRYLATLEESHVFDSSHINSFRLGMSRSDASYGYYTTTYNPLLKDPSLGFIPGHNIGILRVTGLSDFTGGVGRGSGSIFNYTSYQLFDDFYWTHGIHSIKMGFNAEDIRYNADSADSSEGDLRFNSISDFLTNKPFTILALLPGSDTIRGIRQAVIGGYFQDDIRWRKNLTINLGVRYEMVTNPKENHGRLASLKNLTDPTATVGPLFNNNPTLRNFEPRVGFSWDPFGDGKTSIRSGFGIFDILPLPYVLVNEAARSTPFYLGGQGVNLPPGSFPTGAYKLLGPTTLRTVYVQPNPSRSYKLQWNLNIQRDLGRDFTISAGYVGARGVHLPWRNNNMDTVLPTKTDVGYVYPTNGKLLNTNFGRIGGEQFNADSNYNALQVGLRKRLGHGFQGQVSYTWQKSIDTASGAFSSNEYANTVGIPVPFDTRINRGLSDFDVEHVFSANYLWDLPKPSSWTGPAAWLTSGWQLGGIFSATSGQPFTALISGDAAGSLMGNDSMQRPIPICSKETTGKISGWINFACFAAPPAHIVSKNIVGRNTLIGPDLFDVDLSLFKNNHIRWISETANAQFRVEMFNILNHPNFAAPNSPNNNAIFDAKGNLLPSAGVLIATQTPARQIQFGLKLIF